MKNAMPICSALSSGPPSGGGQRHAILTTDEIPAQAPPDRDALGALVDPFVDALIGSDRRGCAERFETLLLADVPILDLYQGLLQPALYRVGDLWANGRISVATEHMATAICAELMNLAVPYLVNPIRDERRAVVAAVDGELHHIGRRMVADVFELHGWDCVLTTEGLSTEEVLGVISDADPSLLGLSFSVYFHREALRRMLERIRAEHPDLPILLGGQGLRWESDTALCADTGITCLPDLDALDDLLRAMAR
jgi:methanogenic corrinoid protein MtbC1